MPIASCLLMAFTCLTAQSLAQTPAQTQTATPIQEVYQDFRGGKDLVPSLKLVGVNDQVTVTHEDQGLRIKLSSERKFPVYIRPEFALKGDFEITLRYDLLAAEEPAKGYGTGVSINVANDGKRAKFASVNRVLLPKFGNVNLAQAWDNITPDKKPLYVPRATMVKSGQLKIKRTGELIEFFATDEKNEAPVKFSRIKLGTDDLNDIKIVVSNSGAAGNPVEARFVDLRITSFADTPLAASTPPTPVNPSTTGSPSGGTPSSSSTPATSNGSDGKSGFATTDMLLLALTVLLVLTIVGFLVVRLRRKQQDEGDDAGEESEQDEDDEETSQARPAEAISFGCPKCRKRVRAKPALAGRNIRCPKCGSAVTVPDAEE